MRRKFKNATIKALMEPSHMSGAIKGKYFVWYYYEYDVSMIQDGPHDGQIMNNTKYQLHLINRTAYMKCAYERILSKEEHTDLLKKASILSINIDVENPYKSIKEFADQCNLFDAGGTIIVANND